MTSRRIWIVVAATLGAATLLMFPPFNYHRPVLTKVGWQDGPVTFHHFVLSPPTPLALINMRNLLVQLTAIIIGFSVLMILTYRLSKVQKIILALGVISILAMAAFPPWEERVNLDDGRFVIYDVGYSLSHDQRIQTGDFTGGIRVCFPRLYAQLAAVVAVTGIGLWVAGRRKRSAATCYAGTN